MDDTLYGTRDKSGHWKPNRWIKRAPVFVWPIQPKPFLRWLFSYLWPYNALYFAIALLVWFYLTPPLETMQEFGFGWILLILLRNTALVLLVYGGSHAVFYIQRRQRTDFKYNAKWPDTDNSMFLFGSQTAENIFWAMCSGVPVFTAYEVLTWWMFANAYIPHFDFMDRPVFFVTVLLLVPLWRELHFYLIHRLIHLGPLYEIVHKVHHNNVNPGPWSGLSMHTLEHIVFFSAVLIFYVVPSQPLLIMFVLIHLIVGPARGHLGFDAIAVSDDKILVNDNYYHYLHHKYFEVNYGERLIPFDEWLGTAHDGSPEADEAMFRRLKAKKNFVRGVSH
ncbi:sterol desaturase family protein [Bradyrhizobium sp. CSA207]|uniref:sterol desaturase family protein n=1 Tax=Bradyrhizobium sp. CSA207 TaxID=2698826 RepID=UPI0023B184D3|nr:sterol desaturase family protein [Bradyrhizobium sp. CSA207]MDE5446756.1 sterol desaturase family protein [Bradyrhizobium sp. CSA207]